MSAAEAPKMPILLRLLTIGAALACIIVPSIWLARLQCIGHLRIWRTIHHKRGLPQWTTFRLEPIGFKTLQIEWWAMHDSAKGLRDLLARYGVASYVWAIDFDGTFHFKVRQAQAHWAEWLLLKAGSTPCSQWEPETYRALPGLNRNWQTGKPMPTAWSKRMTKTGTWDEFMLDNFIFFVPPLWQLAELPFALMHLIEFKTEHKHHDRKVAVHAH